MSKDGHRGSVSQAEEIALLRQQLAQAQQLTAIGELASTVTHEFNNVLMTVLNYAKMGLRHKDEATRDKAFQKILTAGERANRITNSVLGMARNRSDSFEPTNLGKLVEESLVLLERELRKYRVSVETNLADVPAAKAIGNQIQQILLNLLTNARQAMPDGGRIIITLSHDAANETVDLSIRDTGSGIAADKLPQIFDPFFSTKAGPDSSGKGGTGLGLATCRSIVETHRGRIRVESKIGVGTAFIIRLPVYSRRPASPPAPVTAATTSTLPTSQHVA